MRVRLNGSDVTRRFAARADGRFVGLVTGLDLGRNRLRATSPGLADSTRIVNHRLGGPVFSGPQLRHYRCQETAVDARCNEPATYRLFYRSSDPAQSDLQPYDREDPPSDVASTTTDEGIEVPFIVRREYGYQDRDRYTVLALWQPGQRTHPLRRRLGLPRVPVRLVAVRLPFGG